MLHPGPILETGKQDQKRKKKDKSFIENSKQRVFHERQFPAIGSTGGALLLRAAFYGRVKCPHGSMR